MSLFAIPPVSAKRVSPVRRRGRLGRRCRARVESLEDRTLLSSTAADVLAGIAVPIALGTPTSGMLAAGSIVFYQVNPTVAGALVAQVQSDGALMRLSLLNGQDQVLMQSDGQSAANPDPLIDTDVAAGPEYLEVENVGAASTYTLTAALTPAAAPFQPIPISPMTEPSALVTGDFNGDGKLDLAVSDSVADEVEVFLNNSTPFQAPEIYAVGADPGSIVAGDFTGDGRTDLAVVNQGDNDVSVLLGNGDGTFQDQVTYAVGSAPSGIAAGDFTGNGKIDLAVTNAGSNDVSILLGNGNGTFQNQVTYAMGSQPDAIVAGDFRGDGKTDLAVANYAGGDVSVLLGNGDGSFQNQAIYAVGFAPKAIIAGDLTGGGTIDLAVANEGSDDVSVLHGTGDGTFQTQAIYGVGSEPNDLVAGDFLHDGHTDLAVTNAGDDDLSVLPGNRFGGFDSQVTSPVGPGVTAVVAGNFHGNGTIYLAVANAFANSVTLYQDNGDGTFQYSVARKVGAAPAGIAAGDFTGDGTTDLAVANLGFDDVSILLGNGDGTFRTGATYAVGSGPYAIVAGDFTGNGRTDLAVVTVGDSEVSVLLGNGDGTFQDAVSYAVGSIPEALVAGDFTGNGKTDLAVANSGDNDVSILLGNGDGTFQAQVTYAVGSFPDALAAGDFTGNGKTDLAVVDNDDNDVSILLGNGDGTFLPRVTYAAGSQPDAIVTGDFTGNGRTDLAVANSGSNNVSILLGNGDGTFQNQVTYAVGSGPVALVAGDFTGNGRTDLATANGGSDDVSILLGNGDGTFQTQVTYAVGPTSETDPDALVAGDFTGDGRTDLATANFTANAVSVLLGNGDGTFQTAVLNEVGSDPEAIVAGDFNGDGRTDLAVANFSSNDVSILLGNGDGTFQDQATYAVGSGPDALVTGDFNGDGRLDLAVANSGDNDVSILLGNGDGTFQPQVTYAVGTFPDALVAGDFTGDGKTDLAVSNRGDFDVAAVEINGQEIIPGEYFYGYGGDDVSVLLGNGDGTFKPQVTYAVGAVPVALVAGDFTGDGKTDLAAVNALSNSVSILLGNGNGTFQRQVTYAVGPFPVAIAAGDFTGDGKTDLAVANSLARDVSVLLGNGDGTFQNQVTYAVGSDPDALVAGDFTGNGRTDLAVANSEDDNVSVLSGNGDGTFQTQATYAAGSRPAALVAADFNGDRTTDLATANSVADNVSVALNVGGTFVGPGSSVTTPRAAPVVADLTGDGVDDVFVVNGAGDILWRRGRPQEPGTYDPPITINPGHPSRDIVAVDTNQGLLLASVDATDDAVSLYAWRGGGFVRIGSLPTGLLPAQVVAAGLTGDGLDDLVVRNAGDGTLSVYFNSGNESGPATTLPPPFLPPLILTVGPGVSDVTLADVSGAGRTDIVVTDKLTGEVGVLRNVGLESFLPAVFYRAGGGLYAQTSAGGSATVTTLEATAGVAAAALSTGAASDLVAIDPGSNTFSELSGLGGGRFANPATFLTATPATQVLVADLEGNGIPDTIVLSASGVTVYRGDGQGGFLPDPFTIGAGLDPTGMTLADINGDGKLDLLIDNAYGDLLVLLGNGDGTFRPYRNADQDVALAVLPNGSAAPDFIYADQGLDQVVVDYAGGQTNVVANRSSGLLVPGAVVLADLNGDGIPDLIVANSGGNDVLIYPGLPGGQFGPEVNGGKGFAVGTDPVGITVANLNGRPDLVVANQGTNDVSILLNMGGFTFVAGPRLAGGDGPVATVVTSLPGNPFPDLLISDSESNQVRLLRGVGGGFFNDQDPKIFNVGTTPGPLFVGNFTDNPSELDLVTVNSGSNDLSLVTDINGGNTVAQSIPSGGVFPIAAVEGDFGGTNATTGGDDLLVANNEDGHLSLFLSGADGLDLSQTFEEPGLPNPTALAVTEDGAIFADNEGAEAAIPVILGLGGTSGTTVLPRGPEEQQVVSLQPLSPMSLGLIATLLSVPGELAGTPEAQSATGGSDAAGQGGGTTATSQGVSQFSVAVAPAGSLATVTSEPSEAEASVAAAPGGAVVAALPNQPAPKGVAAGRSGDGAAEDAEIQGSPARPQAAPAAVAQFIAGVDASFVKARLRVRLGALFGAVARVERGVPSAPKLSAVRTDWTPILAGLGTPGLALAVELAQAALSLSDPGTVPPPPAAADASPGPASTSSDFAPIATTAVAAVSLRSVIAVVIGLSAAVWGHVKAAQPRFWGRYRLRVSGRKPSGY